MKKKLLLAAVSAATLLWSLPANATSITGQVSIFGTSILDSQAQTITFLSGSYFSSMGPWHGIGDGLMFETGSFTVLGDGGSLVWRNQGTPLGFNNLATGSDLWCGDTCLFGGANNGVTFTFNILSATASAANGMTVLGTGLANLTGFDPTVGAFSLTSQGGFNLGFTVAAPPVPVPLGSSMLPSLVAGLVGLFALHRRRKLYGAARAWAYVAEHNAKRT
jgi:hypothetical protein